MWAGSLTLRLGEYHVGIRSSHGELHDLLKTALAGHVVEGVDAPPNYSVELAGHAGPDGEVSDFHFVYRGFTPVIRTRDPHRLVNGLLSHLAGQLPAPPGHLELNVVALVRNGECILCPPDVRQFLATFERRLTREGISVADRPSAFVDPGTGEMVISESGLQVDEAALGAIGSLGPQAKRPDPTVGPGRYPVRGWAFGRGPEGAGPLPLGTSIAEATKLVLNMREMGGDAVLAGLHSILTGAGRVALWAEEPEGLIPLIVALATRPQVEPETVGSQIRKG